MIRSQAVANNLFELRIFGKHPKLSKGYQDDPRVVSDQRKLRNLSLEGLAYHRRNESRFREMGSIFGQSETSLRQEQTSRWLSFLLKDSLRTLAVHDRSLRAFVGDTREHTCRHDRPACTRTSPTLGTHYCTFPYYISERTFAGPSNALRNLAIASKNSLTPVMTSRSIRFVIHEDCEERHSTS